MLTILHPIAEGAVRKYLGYDPEQKSHTERLPRQLKSGGPGFYANDVVDIVGSTAVWKSSVGGDTLQLTHIPLRAITTVHVDTSARFGDASGAFPDSTLWTQGDDYWVEWEDEHLCLGGMLYSYANWPFETGTIKVVYTGGYSAAELAGNQSANDSAGGVYTNESIDATGIAHAVLVTIAHAIHTWQQLKKDSRVGFVPGTIQSERLGDYSYTLGPGSANIAGAATSLPSEAEQLLQPFLHYGLARL